MSRSREYRTWAWVAWVVALGVWTGMLLTPDRVLRPLGDVLSWGKLLHVAAYAALTGWVFVLTSGRSGRFMLWAALSAHGFLTESLQNVVPGRTGSFRDVAIDHAGIVLGLLSGGLWDRLRGGGRSAGAAPPQVQQDAGGEDQDADLLRHRQAHDVSRRVVP
jgi:hypothetical protein